MAPKSPQFQVPPKDYRGAIEVAETLTMRPIGIVRSEYTERHGTPRQAFVSSEDQRRPMPG